METNANNSRVFGLLKKFPQSAIFLMIWEFFVYFSISSQLTLLDLISLEKINRNDVDTVREMQTTRWMSIFAIFPAWLADSFVGKFWVINVVGVFLAFWPLSIIFLLLPGQTHSAHLYVYRTAVLFSMILEINEPTRKAFMIEQMELPEHGDYLIFFLILILLLRSVTSAIAAFVTLSQKDDEKSIYVITSTVLIIFFATLLALTIIRKRLKWEPPVKFIYSQGIFCLYTAIVKKIRSCGKKKTKEEKKHFMDYAESRCDVFFIYNCKVFLKLTQFFVIALFVELSDKYVKRVTHGQLLRTVPCTINSRHYNSALCSTASLRFYYHFAGIFWTTILFLFFLGLFKWRKWNVSSLIPLTIGHIITGLAITSALFVENALQHRATPLPNTGFGQVRIFNSLLSPVIIHSPAISALPSKWEFIPGNGAWTSQNLDVQGVKEGPLILKYLDQPKSFNSTRLETLKVVECEAVSYIITEDQFIRVVDYDPIMKKVAGSDPMFPTIYALCGSPFCSEKLVFRRRDFIQSVNLSHWRDRLTIFTMPVGKYNVTSESSSTGGELINNVLRNVKFKIGGVYALLLHTTGANGKRGAVFTIVKPNRVTFKILIPQILLSSLGTHMTRAFSWMFIYTESPPKLRCTMFAVEMLWRSSSFLIVYVDKKYWHYRVCFYQILVFLVIHFGSTFALIYLAIRYEYQKWCTEGAIFPGCPPLATKWKEAERRKMSTLKRTAAARAEESATLTRLAGEVKSNVLAKLTVDLTPRKSDASVKSFDKKFRQDRGPSRIISFSSNK